MAYREALEGLLNRTLRADLKIRQSQAAFRLFYVPAKPVTLSVVMPTAGTRAKIRGVELDLVSHCVGNFMTKAGWPGCQFIVVHNGNLSKEVRRTLLDHGCELVFYKPKGRFNLAEKINLGAKHANGDLLLILNDDTELKKAESVQTMAGLFDDPTVGIVACKLLYDDKSIQHVGDIFIDAVPMHILHGKREKGAGYFGANEVTQQLSAVMGAVMMTRRSLFKKIGGFDVTFPFAFNDIDFCLHAITAGYRVVYTPEAEFFHFESKSRDISQFDWSEQRRFVDRWYSLIRKDRFYNMNLGYAPYYGLRQ